MQFSEKARSELFRLFAEEAVFVEPYHLPMVVPPQPRSGRSGGGYLVTPISLIKRDDDPSYSAELGEGDLSISCQAATIIQETPWRINRRVHQVVLDVWKAKEPKHLLPAVEPPEIPPRIEKASVSAEEFQDHLTRVRDAWRMTREAEANQVMMATRLEICRRLESEPEIYFPCQLDFRGRVYPVPQVVNPQVDDQGRALIEFARPKPLGKRGAYWLAVHLANLYGQDKVSFDKRVDWVENNRDAILDSATRPLAGKRFWTKADKPWRFLATAFEWAEYTNTGPGFASRARVAMDGTCNGLQHLSALGRDPEGAAWTNLIPGPVPRDIYQEVADRLRTDLEGRAKRRSKYARAWLPYIDRTLVKQPTMTTPYSVTRKGIQQQVLSAIRGRGLFEKEWAAASFLAPLLQAAIASVVIKAAELNDWLRRVASLLAKKGQPLKWVPPNGFPVHNDYRKLASRRVSTAMGAQLIWDPEGKSRPNVSRQKSGIVPNLVHSLDAAHLMLTVRELHRRGLTDFGMVHDSYGTHACDVDLMNEVIRDQFIVVHTEFTLGALALSAQEAAPGVAVPPPPEPGTLQLEQVRQSDYCFS